MAYTFDENTVSDLHKDARGRRPDEYFWEEWTQVGDAGRQMIWDSLIREFNDTVAAERAAQDQALADFRDQIKAMRKLGAETERQAIKWIFHSQKLDRYDLQYGADYVAWNLGLAYDNPYKAVIQECCDQALAVVAEEEKR